MLPIDTESFGWIYSIKLTSPLSIEECKNRLQQSLGKAMGSPFTPIEGEVEIIDATTCKFRLYQDVSSTRRHTITGYLYAQTESSTAVDAVFGINRQSEQAFLTLVTLLGVIIIALVISHQIIAAIIAGFILGTAFYFERRVRSNPPRQPREFTKEPMSQLVWWFERTLKQ